jgi:hypothetical protein
MPEYENLIRQLGSAGIASTGPGERAHGDLNAAASFTNKHADTRIDQVHFCTAKNATQSHSPGNRLGHDGRT